jgi:hypothetical protein
MYEQFIIDSRTFTSLDDSLILSCNTLKHTKTGNKNSYFIVKTVKIFIFFIFASYLHEIQTLIVDYIEIVNF